MTAREVLSGNILGQLSAEADKEMLEKAFYESQDYKTVISTNDKVIIVGRRGCGKSALAHRIKSSRSKDQHTIVTELMPTEDEMFGFRDALSNFGGKYTLARAVSRIIWTYGILMEVAVSLRSRSGSKTPQEAMVLESEFVTWQKTRLGTCARLRAKLTGLLSAEKTQEANIADLSGALHVDALKQYVADAIIHARKDIVIILDKIDEGYEQDLLGVGILGGITYACLAVSSMIKAKVLLFMRDNMFRALKHHDPDFSRKIEGHVLRMHWEKVELFNFACLRLRAVFELDAEKNLKIWNACTARDLSGSDGFETCLRLTLYRPRDLLHLLNSAFYNAGRKNSRRIVLEDVELGAKEISESRLGDLIKEYSDTIPALQDIIQAFYNQSERMNYDQACLILDKVLATDSYGAKAQQNIALLDSADEILAMLYGVGFMGIRNAQSGSFVFSHDGRSVDLKLASDAELLIHPCYLRALNISQSQLGRDDAEEIYDEYDITLVSEEKERRKKALGQRITALGNITEGHSGQDEFEEWCCEAVKVAFSGYLRNVQLRPNASATQRRDIVATNTGEGNVWSYILSAYKAHQVIFEVKNHSELGPAEFRQMLSYLTGPYGNLGFFINRAKKWQLEKGKALDWVQEMWKTHSKLILILPASVFSDIMSKLRSPQKFDVATDLLEKILDTYERMYLSGQPSIQARKRKAKRKQNTK